MLELMVQLGVDLHQKDSLKQTPLFYAAKNGYLKLQRLLVGNGMDVNQIDTYGQNAIYYAVNAGHFESI